jgi:hypothetical protein
MFCCLCSQIAVADVQIPRIPFKLQTVKSPIFFVIFLSTISYNPTLLDISQADKEKSDTEDNKQSEINRYGDRTTNAEGTMKNVYAVRRRKHVGKRSEKNGQTLDRKD